jgi:hypothetical protein
MTTQVALRATTSVAMASDTARSLSNDDGTRTVVNGTKFFQPASRVLAMTAGKSGLGGIPHQHIAGFQLDSSVDLSPLEVAKQFAEKLIAGLEACGRSESDLTLEFLCGSIARVDEMVDGAILTPLKAVVTAEDKEGLPTAFGEMVDRLSAEVEKLKTDENLVPIDEESITTSLLNLKDSSMIEHVCDDLGIEHVDVPMKVKRLLAKAIAALSTKVAWNREDAIITFAGFGPSDPMPSFVTLTIVGAPGAQLIYSMEEDNPVTNGDLANFVFPAQDSAQQQMTHGMTFGDLASFVDLAAEGVKVEFEVGDDKLQDFADKLRGTTIDYLNHVYTQPFLRVIRSLDAPGLARVADLLARMQELRAVCSNSQATVGGVIEVATITQHEGIRWHRRLDVSLDGNGASVLG